MIGGEQEIDDNVEKLGQGILIQSAHIVLNLLKYKISSFKLCLYCSHMVAYIHK